MRLTEAKIRAAKPRTNAAGKLTDHWMSDGGGLYLRVLPSSLKCWMIRRKLNGKALPPVRLGNYPSMSLKEARHEATGYQLQKDVSTATVADLVERYRLLILSHHRRPRMFGGYIDRSILPVLGARRVRDITTAELVNLIQNYGTHKRGTTGDRARDQFRSMLKQMFGLAVEIGWRTDNPAGAITSRVTGYSYQPRERILTCDEVRKLWSETNSNARVLRFLLLTGVRISEAQQASPEAAQNGIWDIPGSLTKNGKPHRVYLTESAQAELPLPSCTPTNVQAWLKRWSIKQGIEDRFTPHDLRRTFATWLNESGTEPYVVEKCLAHAMAGVMAVYNRAEYWEQRQEAYQTMQDVVHSIVGEPAMY